MNTVVFTLLAVMYGGGCVCIGSVVLLKDLARVQFLEDYWVMDNCVTLTNGHVKPSS